MPEMKSHILALIIGLILLSCSNESDNWSCSPATSVDYDVEAAEDISVQGGRVKRSRLRIVLPTAIRAANIEQFACQVVTDKTKADPDLDAIAILLYSEQGVIYGAYDIAKIDWAPNGRFGDMTPVIAKRNDRTNYAMDMDVRDDLDSFLDQRGKKETKFGFSEPERRKIFLELVASEDRADRQALEKYPYEVQISREILKAYSEFQTQLTEKYRGELRGKLGINDETLTAISSEGLEKNWPMPPTN